MNVNLNKSEMDKILFALKIHEQYQLSDEDTQEIEDTHRLEGKLKRARSSGARSLRLSVMDIGLLIHALDSYEYWDLSETQYRSSGYVLGAGSDDPETIDEIKRVRSLMNKLERIQRSGAKQAR